MWRDARPEREPRPLARPAAARQDTQLSRSCDVPVTPFRLRFVRVVPPGGRGADRRRRGPAVILGIETSCDETAAAVVTHDGEIRANVVASQVELHARFGGVVPGGRVAAAPRARLAGDPGGARPAPTRRSTSRHGRGHGRAGADRRAARRGRGGEGARVGAAAAARARRPPRTATSPRSTCGRLDLEPPFTCLLASGGHTLLLDVRGRSWADVRVLGRTLDDAAGEAFDKGARLLGLPYPGGAEIDRLAADRRPGGVLVPGRARARARLLLLRAEDRAALRRPRPRAGRARRAEGGPRGELPARDRARARRAARGGGRRPRSRSSAASPRTPSCARRSRDAVAAPLALCTDNAAMIASAARYTAAAARPRRLALDAYASAVVGYRPPTTGRGARMAIEQTATCGRTRSSSRASSSARSPTRFGIDDSARQRPPGVQEVGRGLDPDADGRRLRPRLHRLPRHPQRRARAVEGRHPLPPRRHARRGQGARDGDDVEVRADGPAVRRREGRRHLRPEADVAAASSSA